MMVVKQILGILLLVVSVLSQEPKARVVNTAQGPVRGYLEPKFGLFGFYGVPYASTPLGTQRFRVYLLKYYFNTLSKLVNK